MENIEEIIKRMETTLERHSERFVIIEGKLANDYKSIASLVNDVQMLKEASETNSKVISSGGSSISTFTLGT